MLKYIFAAALLSLVLSGCTKKNDKLFSLMDEDETGIDFRNLLQESDDMNVMNYSYFYNGAGVSVGDINNDGLQDLLFTGNMVKNRLYLNKGNFEFEDITDKSGIASMQGWCTGATMVDINGDGHLDIYICRSADINPERRKNLLFINNGDLTFTEKAEEYGLADHGYSTQASFFDYDKDGDLDMFLINHSLQQYTTGVQENVQLRKEQNPDFANKLYRNDNGKFRDISAEAGITSNVLTFGLGLAVSDINNDSWPDIYVSNDFNEPDYLFINNGDGTFTDKLTESMSQISMYSMGSDVADYNNDGLPDIVTLDMLPESNETQKMHSGAENFDKMQFLFDKGFYYQFSRNMLQKNNGDGTFSEIGQIAGISNTDWSWAALLTDLDRDGKKDLFVTNGYVKDYTDMDFLKYTMDETIRSRQQGNVLVAKDFIQKMPTIVQPNYVFQNVGNDRFEKKNKEWGLDQKGISAGAVYADLDNDGDLDLVVSNTNDFASVYRNNSELLNKNTYLRVQLKGDQQNSLGIGAKVILYAKGVKYYQEQIPVRGFQSSVDPVLNFGLGENQLIDSLFIVWPNDKSQIIKDVKVNQTLTLDLKNANLDLKFIPIPSGDTYLLGSSSVNYIHTENQFNDFTVQTLLPNYLSRPGPAMAKGDFNGDGIEDLFIGGAAGQASALFTQTTSGDFIKKNSGSLETDAQYEDTAAEFLDIDGDGDLDLYVGSGGYEFGPDSPWLQDRVYINDGKGNFTKKADGLPKMLSSTGTVRSSDIDGDGDLDLFIGSRVVPGMYPSTPESKILINDGKGNFSDLTDNIAPEIKFAGMVTDAVWIDVNQDKVNDLIIVGEWMPIRIFLNQKGKLVDRSSEFIKFGSSGWWNTIHVEDMDADGDQDLVIGNLGLNAQFKASEKEPMSIYYKDFDENGSVDPIFCYYIDGVSYPAASRDDLMDQLPSLKNKFLEYHKYANATINDLFTPDQLKDAKVLKAELLETVYLENTGKGFNLKKLPVEAQYAPVYAIASADVDKDGKKDLLLAGNNSWTRIKFGHFTSSSGTLLSGNGKGEFTYVPQWKSGLNIRGNVRSLEAFSIGKKSGHQFIFGINNAPVKTIKIN
ncbi:MAG: VCBS repeat-containing protein [Daejeonella sp.]|uniref:VCBS repeat-containing protein n=1 Tax=Daejeonella sp. TaxID=2805397 RepID=UPI002736744D|nr:VCBS repeat-containing protein [Daejeonella sp.]MDP3468078.1 VCBS repeat-containing protein [Daejeonella sp.]